MDYYYEDFESETWGGPISILLYFVTISAILLFIYLILSAPSARNNIIREYIETERARVNAEDALTTARQRRTEVSSAGQRKMFGRIKRRELKSINEHITSNGPFPRTPGNSNTKPENQRINADDIQDPIKNDYGGGLIAPTITKYLQLICHYVNESATPPRHLDGTIPICAHMSYNWFGSRRQPQNPLRIQWLSKELDNSKLTADNMLNTITPINYIFIPVEIQYRGLSRSHSTLLVLSPRNKTIEFLDSDGRPNMDKILDLCRILDFHLGRNFIPDEWKTRTGRAFVQQTTATDCSFHTTANAMALAFGYPLHDGNHSIRNRRERFASELLNGGFNTFDKVPKRGNRFFYPLNPLLEDNDAKDGWRPISKKILDKLPVATRLRKAVYNGFMSKDDLLKWCKSWPNLEKYRGCDAAYIASITLDQFREWVELRDEQIRTKAYIPNWSWWDLTWIDLLSFFYSKRKPMVPV